MKDSFHGTEIELESRGWTRSKAPNRTLDYKQDKGEEPTQSPPLRDHGGSPPQKKGKEIHEKLKQQIKKDTRDGIAGEILKTMEDKFSCKFIQAEVSISGFAVMRKRYRQVDFWSGKMDAVAIRRSEKDVLEVFVVDWKTTAATEKPYSSNIPNWWDYATNFKRPLYQCLVYRKLLLAHLKRYMVEAFRVGIIVVPLHQLTLKLHPRLCVDFQRMVEEHLLDELNKFQWLAVLDDSIYVHTIKLPCKLFKESFDPAVDVDESTKVLKGDTRLKDILNENATVADLLRAIDLPILKVEGTKKEEKKAQKDDKTSGIEIAASTRDKPNEELEEVKQKKKSSSSHRGAQEATRKPLKLPLIVEKIKKKY